IPSCITSVARGAIARATALDGAATPRDGIDDKPIERPSGVRPIPAPVFIDRVSAAAGEVPLPSVFVGFGFPDVVTRTRPIAQAGDTGWSNGSARRPKPEVMLIRSSGMRTDADSVLWPVASQNGSALDLPIRKRWPATVPLAAVP